MTPVTLLCYRLQVTVWLDKHSDQKSQVMATLEMAKFGPGTSAWEAARFNMAVSTTDGFQQAECSRNIQSANNIGFWCDWGGGDGSVMMIGGGGSACERADHGIGITENHDASFVDLGSSETEYDFGYDANTGNAPSQSYSLNLWIR